MVDDKESGISFVTVCIVFGIKLTIAREFYPFEWANDQRGKKLFLPSAATTIVFSFCRSTFCLSICIFLSFRFDRVYLYAGQCICCDDELDTARVSLRVCVCMRTFPKGMNPHSNMDIRFDKDKIEAEKEKKFFRAEKMLEIVRLHAEKSETMAFHG